MFEPRQQKKPKLSSSASSASNLFCGPQSDSQIIDDSESNSQMKNNDDLGDIDMNFDEPINSQVEKPSQDIENPDNISQYMEDVKKL